MAETALDAFLADIVDRSADELDVPHLEGLLDEGES
jgi:hypothetical protein